ncbi:MAG: sigma-54-dependent Fis family transcriptional regulator [Candidatus Sumerlaeia bacterium]|nr:sigma-54-dependent Fis family transcriptional regulator [Candidatus Sumerlaeia bacterium]
MLIVDDDDGQRRLLEGFLRMQGHATLTASSAPAALEVLAATPVALVITDMRMPGMTGLELLRAIRERDATLPVLLVTAFPDIRDAVGAMRDGAANYLEKPIDLDELLATVRHAMRAAPGAPLAPGPAAPDIPEGVVAESPAMRAVVRDALLVAPTDSRVLLTGESGTGKEVVADLIHAASARAAAPIVKVNCAAIPESLLESELFGHEKGAFTGASARRVGWFEEAAGGTILLDEIGEMDVQLQAKILRVMQDGGFRRVGGSATLHTDVRILAATNRDPHEQIAAGRLREDLFYRLSVFEIHIPPLRDRPEDIFPLATHFASDFLGARARFSPAAVALLCAWRWPGNVRELRNAMERAVLLSRNEIILPEHLPKRLQAPAAPDEESNAALHVMADVERSVILQALRENRFNRSETARILGISRRALLYKLQKLREQGFDVDG